MKRNNKSFTNEVAEKFWGLYGIMRTASIVVFIIIIGIAIYLQSLTFFFIGLIMLSIVLLWTILFLGASEILERLQNIENNLKN